MIRYCGDAEQHDDLEVFSHDEIVLSFIEF